MPGHGASGEGETAKDRAGEQERTRRQTKSPRSSLRAALQWLWHRGNRAGRIAKLKGGKADRRQNRL